MNSKLPVSNQGWFFMLLVCCCGLSLAHAQDAVQDYRPLQLTPGEQLVLKRLVERAERSFDPAVNMIKQPVNGYQYHTDATTGEYHQVRASLHYALALLNTGDPSLRPRALAVLRKATMLQDNDSASRTCGVWPYYLEEPLKVKSSPPDFNMADFNAVTLIDVWLGYHALLPAGLQDTVRNAILLAARSIRKRNVDPGYTNIAMMGTYVTYMAGHLFSDAGMVAYADDRLRNVYRYTLAKKGFTEYNSPTYTVTALEELNRMQMHFTDPEARLMADSMYTLCWQMIARHYHAPSGQWSGPHSRAYSSLAGKAFYNLLHESSGGKLFKEDTTAYNYSNYRRNRHAIPAWLMPYFTHPTLPRTEYDVFEPDTPQVTGTSFLARGFALSSCNHASLWNQRRPLIAYWGSREQPKYLQVRMLHDFYDFSSASLTAAQHENKVLAAVNFSLGLGDKHIHIDKLDSGRFKAKDLRLRFEFGNARLPDNLRLPDALGEPIDITVDGVHFSIGLFACSFGDSVGYWQKGGNGKVSWIDYVLYSGDEKAFNLTALHNAVAAFTLMLNEPGKESRFVPPVARFEGAMMHATWEGLPLSVNTDVRPVRKHGGWY